ncbi:MAG: 5-carboxymethyl-2-hydroxymuconate Delta-isomerase [Bacteroidia bacterium]
MPHFVIDCSQNILDIKTPQEIMEAVYLTAESTGLFTKGDIKVRIRPFEYFKLGEGKDTFIHVFANIMEGRSIEQKRDLSHKITTTLKTMFPEVPIISINVIDFEKATYCNRNWV